MSGVGERKQAVDFLGKFKRYNINKDKRVGVHPDRREKSNNEVAQIDGAGVFI